MVIETNRWERHPPPHCVEEAQSRLQNKPVHTALGAVCGKPKREALPEAPLWMGLSGFTYQVDSVA